MLKQMLSSDINIAISFVLSILNKNKRNSYPTSAIGSFTSGTELSFWAKALDKKENHGESEHISVIVIEEMVSTPGRPDGTKYLKANDTGSYVTGGSATNTGGAVEYQFDWGDGTYSSWSASGNANKSWAADGLYNVSARARSA